MLLFALALAAQTPTDAAPNVWGQTGVVHTTSARAPGNLRFDVAASGFLLAAPDYLVPGSDDFNALLGGHLAASMALLDVLELSLASRSASNANSARGPSAFSVGDLYPSIKLGFTFLPVAVGLDVRARLPTRVDAAGFDLENVGVTTQGLLTLDLNDGMRIPVRVHLNGGYVLETGKYAQGAGGGAFEENPNFYDGVDGALLALASDSWFYDQLVGGLAVEAPLPFVTPFLEVFYRGAVGVPANRGPGGAAYDALGDGHLTVTPGARITALDGFTIDLAVDVGLTGTAGGGTDATKIVDGTPPNAPFLLRIGVTSTFDPFAASEGTTVRAGGGPSGQVKGCVVDAGGRPLANAVVEAPALGGARLATDAAGCFLTPPLAPGDVQLTIMSGGATTEVSAAVVDGRTVEVTATLAGASGGAVVSTTGSARVVGYVTNKEDETLEAELEVWDAGGAHAAGKSTGGAFEVPVQAGDVAVVARADGYLAEGVTLHVVNGARGRAAIVLKKLPKARKAVLEKERIAVQTKVPFEFKKPRLQSTAEYVLADVVDVLLRNPTLRVRVEVYAEPLVTPDDSQRLADDRAAAVVDHLVQHGVWRARIEAKGTPLAAAEADKGRRVDFVIVP